MKVIGMAKDGVYLCEVTHAEIEKFLNLYYGKMGRMKVSETIDLGKGYDYASQIGDAMRKTQEFISANQQVVTAILNGLSFQKIAAEKIENAA